MGFKLIQLYRLCYNWLTFIIEVYVVHYTMKLLGLYEILMAIFLNDFLLHSTPRIIHFVATFALTFQAHKKSFKKVCPLRILVLVLYYLPNISLHGTRFILFHEIILSNSNQNFSLWFVFLHFNTNFFHSHTNSSLVVYSRALCRHSAPPFFSLLWFPFFLLFISFEFLSFRDNQLPFILSVA